MLKVCVLAMSPQDLYLKMIPVLLKPPGGLFFHKLVFLLEESGKAYLRVPLVKQGRNYRSIQIETDFFLRHSISLHPAEKLGPACPVYCEIIKYRCLK